MRKFHIDPAQGTALKMQIKMKVPPPSFKPHNRTDSSTTCPTNSNLNNFNNNHYGSGTIRLDSQIKTEEQRIGEFPVTTSSQYCQMISPSSALSPSLNLDSSLLENNYKNYERTYQSNISQLSGDERRSGAVLGNELRSMISRHDQNIQNKLKAFADFKDSLTNTMSSHSNRTSSNQRDLKLRGLSEELKKQIVDNGLKANYSQMQQVDQSPQSIATYNQQREYYKTDLSYRTGISQELTEQKENSRVGFQNQDYSQHTNSEYLGGPRAKSFDQQHNQYFLKNLVMKQRKANLNNGSESNLHQLPMQANPPRDRNYEVLGEHNYQINTQTSSLITLGDKKSQLLTNPQVFTSSFANPIKQTQDITKEPPVELNLSNQLNSAPTEITQDAIQEQPGFLGDPNTVGESYLDEGFHRRRPSAYSALSAIGGQDEFLKMKTAMNEQNRTIQALQKQIVEQDENFQRQLTRSVERIFVQLENIQQQINFRSDEEEKKYDFIFRKMSEIKSHKRRSRRNGKDDKRLQPQVREYEENMLSKSTSQITSDICQTSNIGSQQTLNSAHFGVQGNYYQDQQKTIPRVSQPAAAYNFHPQIREATLEESTQSMAMDEEAQLNLRQNEAKLEEDFCIAKMPDEGTLSSPQGKFMQRGATMSQDLRQKSKCTLITGHTISFNAEIDKVREESQKKISELRSFYEEELLKMRKEFESREVQIKEKMQEQLKENVEVEKSKVTSQMQQLFQEKQFLEEKLNHRSKRKGSKERAHQRQSQMSKGSQLESDATPPRSIRQSSAVVSKPPPPSGLYLKERVANTRKGGQQYGKEEYAAGQDFGSAKNRNHKHHHQDHSDIAAADKENCCSYPRDSSQKARCDSQPSDSKRCRVRPSESHGSQQLHLKEKDILRRIHKIESFLNRP